MVEAGGMGHVFVAPMLGNFNPGQNGRARAAIGSNMFEYTILSASFFSSVQKNVFEIC
jgi:hypothetical protein